MERWRRTVVMALVRLRFVVLLAAVALLAVSRTAISTVLRQATAAGAGPGRAPAAVALLAVSRTAISTVLRQLTRADAGQRAAPAREGAWICPMHPGVRHGGA